MSNSTTFHTQIASIMEVLANAAVAEICQVVDDGYAVLRLEISQYQKENKTLKRRLQMMERQAARRCAEKAGMRANFADRALVSRKFRDPASAVRVLESQSDPCQRDDGQPIVLDEEDPLMEGAARGEGVNSYQDTANAECIYMEEGRTESLLIQEKLKENQGTSGHQGVLKNRDERGVESETGGEGRLYPAETQPGAEKQERAPVQPRTKRSVWDIGGDSQEESVKNPQQLGTDSKIQRANGMDSDFGMFDRTGQLGSYCAQGGSLTEKHDPCCSFSTETGPQGLSFHSEMRSFSAAEDGGGNSLSPLGSLDWKPDIIVVDSVPVKQESEIPPAWKGGSVLGMAGALQRPFDEIGGRGEILPESVTSICLPPPQISAGLNATVSKHVTAESDGEMRHRANAGDKRLFYSNFGRSKDCKVLQSVEGGERQFSCTQCGKRFAHSANLKRHQRVHTGEKPYSCTQCEKRFSHQHQLKMHQRVHTGERPFNCTHCGKRFTQSSHIKRHLLVHTAEIM